MNELLVSAISIQNAAAGLRDVAIQTPLVPARWLQKRVGGAEVRLKCENLQVTGAFKIRGAYTMISRLPDALRQRGVVADSSGNHAQAVAFAAQQFRVPAVVVMPTTAVSVKVEGARRLGAEIVFEGTTHVERRARAEAIARERGSTWIPSFDHPDIIAGQGTVGLEVLRDWPEVETILVPVGGGGQISGIASWIKHAKPGCLVVGVQPATADAMRRSWELGRVVTLERTDTVADGLRVEQPSELTLGHARTLVDQIVTVEEPAILQATAHLLQHAKLLVEFSGAITVAALLSGRWQPEGRRTVAILSGGNMESARISELLAGATLPEMPDAPDLTIDRT